MACREPGKHNILHPSLYDIILSKVVENAAAFALIKSSMLERKKKSCNIDTNTYIMERVNQ